MKFLRFIFLSICLFIFSSCEDLSFTAEDLILSKGEFLESEVSVISGYLELLEDKLIHNKKVILEEVIIKTNEYNLTILANEFISNHAFIYNFEKEQIANPNKEGKNGGQVLIQAKKAKGSLRLFLSGENAGFVPAREISDIERMNLSGRNGEAGYNAIYKTRCQIRYIPIFNFKLNEWCWNECLVEQTAGTNGEDGRQGYPGYEGKKGGNSGSFYLKAFDLKEFYLTELKKQVGVGSKGGFGSLGGFGGKAGFHGLDDENLCSKDLPLLFNGSEGARGKRGQEGENGNEGLVCFETLDEKEQRAKTHNLSKKSFKKTKLNEFLTNEFINLKKSKNKEGVICY